MHNNNKTIQLPAIKGILGDWIYYLTAIPFNEVISRIDNDHSIREYKSLDDVLQRKLSKRSKKIAEYLIREKSRFFNTAIIGLFGGSPNWYNFDFAPSAIPDMTLSDHILNTIGILELTGDETLFSIDGQHRIEGVKQSYKKNMEQFELDELPVIIVAHNDDKEGKIKTRRLFSEINTKALKVTGLDELVTNEDNPIFINARKLYAEYELFDKDEFIALNNKANIDPLAKEFTTILNLKEVNKILYKNIYKHLDFRPTDEIISQLFTKSSVFWDTVIANIPKYNDVLIRKNHSVSDFRSKDGGSMLFRPIGIKIIAEMYILWELSGNDFDGFWIKFNAIDDNLNGEYWKDIIWDNAKKNIKAKTSTKFLREYSNYLLNFECDKEYLKTEFNKAKGIEENNSEKLDLPPQP